MTRPDLDTLTCVKNLHANASSPWRGQSHCAESLWSRPYRPLALSHLRQECSERRGSALCNTTLPEATAAEVINHLGEGWSVRATARLVNSPQRPWRACLRVAGRHATRCHDQQVHGLTPRALEFDEQGSFVKKSSSAAATRTQLRPATCGIILLSPAESKLVVSRVVGTRTHTQTKALAHDTKERLRPGHLPVMFTDAYEGYESAILEALGRRYPAPAQQGSSRRSRRSILRWPQGWAYGQGKKQYKGCGMERVEVRVLYGKARVKTRAGMAGLEADQYQCH